VPIIGGRAGGIPEVVQHGVNGLLITPGDVAALTESMNQLMASANTRAHMGQAGRAHIESSFSISAMIRGNRACYDELVVARGA